MANLLLTLELIGWKTMTDVEARRIELLCKTKTVPSAQENF